MSNNHEKVKIKNIIHASGQMCNQFWIISNLLGDCIENNKKIFIWVVNFDIENFDNIYCSKYIKFPLYPKFITKRVGLKTYKKIIDNIFNNKISIKIVKIILNLFPNIKFEIINVGFEKSPFRLKHLPQILNILRPNLNIIKSIQIQINSKKYKNDLIIGIHIRKGDYKYFENGKYYYSDSNYLSLMEIIISKFEKQNVTFLLVSNEEINLDFFSKLNCFVLEKSNSINDLIGLSLCDYIIGPPSSYSSWASLMNHKPLFFIEEKNIKVSPELFIHIEDKWM